MKNGFKSIQQSMLDLEKYFLKQIRKANKKDLGWVPTVYPPSKKTSNALDRLVKKGKIEGKYSERYYSKRGYWIVKK
jgi:hypothetical protein